MDDAAREAGRQALASLERALAQKPVRDGEVFSGATESLCRLRDGLTAEGDVDRRGTVNAVISAVLAGHFPLGQTPWPEVETAVAALRTVLVQA